jgi:serine/threonine-protein kinase GIN4
MENPHTPDVSIIQERLPFNDLTASPLHVEPYPQRKIDTQVPDTPSQRRLEGVYDRFLMATSGVKRVGKGYQSDNVAPVSNNVGLGSFPKLDTHRAFHSTRRPMPPPVSSTQIRVSVDELGVMNYTSTPITPGHVGYTGLKDDNNTTVALMRRAIKAIVPGKTSKRMSRIAA